MSGAVFNIDLDIKDFYTALMSLLCVIPAAAMCFYPMRDQIICSRKKLVMSMIAVFGTMLPSGAFICTLFSLDLNLVLIPLLLLFGVLFNIFTKVSFSCSIAIFMWVLCIMSILSSAAIAIDSRFNPNIGAPTTSFEYAAIQLSFATFAAVVTARPAKKYSTKLVNDFKLKKVWLITVPITGMLYFFNIFIRPRKYETLYVNRTFDAYICVIVVSLMLLILLTFIFYYIVTSLLEMMKTEERNRVLEMQESRYIKQQKYIEDTAKLRHDFKHTLRTLYELSVLGEYDELCSYLEEYIEEMPQNDTVYYCKNHSINAVLNYYTDQALSADIEIVLRIELPEKLPFSDVDMCGMIGNILDNAITACRTVPPEKRMICFTMTTQNGAQFIIVSSNSFSGKVKMQGNKYLSTGRRGSGIGLDSISVTAHRCGGEAIFSHDAEKKEFYIDIMIPLNNPAGTQE